MIIEKWMRTAFAGTALITCVWACGSCSSASNSANSAAVKPVNAPTPTVQEIIDAKRREQQASTAAPSTQNPSMPNFPKITPGLSPLKMNSLEMKKMMDKSAEFYMKQAKQQQRF